MEHINGFIEFITTWRTNGLAALFGLIGVLFAGMGLCTTLVIFITYMLTKDF